MSSVRISENLKSRIKAEIKKCGFKKESEVINKWMRDSTNPMKSLLLSDYEKEINQLKQENQSLQEQLEVEKHAGGELYDMMEKTTKLLSDWLDRVVVPASLHREVLKLVKENEKLHSLSIQNGILTMKVSVQSDKISKMKQSYDEVRSSIQSILKLGETNV